MFVEIKAPADYPAELARCSGTIIGVYNLSGRVRRGYIRIAGSRMDAKSVLAFNKNLGTLCYFLAFYTQVG